MDLNQQVFESSSSSPSKSCTRQTRALVFNTSAHRACPGCHGSSPAMSTALSCPGLTWPGEWPLAAASPMDLGGWTQLDSPSCPVGILTGLQHPCAAGWGLQLPRGGSGPESCDFTRLGAVLLLGLCWSSCAGALSSFCYCKSRANISCTCAPRNPFPLTSCQHTLFPASPRVRASPFFGDSSAGELSSALL